MPSNLTSETQIQIIMSFGLNRSSAEQVVNALNMVSSSAKEMTKAVSQSTGDPALAARMVSTLQAASNLQSAMARDARAEAQARKEALKYEEDKLKYAKMLDDEFAKHNELSDREKQQLGIGGGRGGGGMFGRGMGPGFAEFMIAMSMRSVPGMMGSPIAEGMMGASSINSAISMFQQTIKDAGGADKALNMVLNSLGPVTIGFTALTVVMTAIGGVIQQGTDALKVATDSLKLYYQTIQTGTTSTIQSQIAKLEVDKGAVDQTLADQSKKFAEMVRGLPKGTDPISAFQLGIATPAMQALKDQIVGLKGESDKLGSQISNLNNAMDSTTVKANDAAVALLTGADRKNKAEQQIAADYAMTSDSATKRISTLLQDESAQQNNIAALQDAIATVKEGTPQYLDYQEKLKAAQQALADDKAEVKNLTDVIIPLIKEREAEAEAAKAQQKAIEDLNKEYEKTLDDMAKTRADIAKLEGDWADTQAKNARDALKNAERDRITDLFKNQIDAAKAAEKVAEGEAKIAKDRAEGEAKILADAEKHLQDEREIYEKHYIDMYRMAQDYLLQRQRDAEDAGDKMQTDADNRDVLAWIRDRENARKEAERKQQDFVIEQQRKMQDFDMQRAQDESNYQQQANDRKAALAKQLADEREGLAQRERQSDALQKQFDGIKLAWQRQDQAQREGEAYASYQRQLAAFRQHLADMEAAASQMGGNYAYAGGLTGGSSNAWNYNVASNVNNGSTFNVNVAAGVTMDTLGAAINGLANSVIDAFKGVGK